MINYHFAISNSILFPADNYKENVLKLSSHITNVIIEIDKQAEFDLSEKS